MCKFHNKRMIELKRIYNRINKQTQNRLQEIFDTFNFNFEELYKISSTKIKQRINTYVEEWKEKGLLTGYFGILAKSIYKRIRVKNSEILELLIYGAYVEEQNKLKLDELNLFKDVANYYYQEGQQEANDILEKNKKKKVSVIPDAIFLALLDMPNSQGYIWRQYIETIIKYNTDQIYRQAIIDIQQNRKVDIQDSIYQDIIKKQQNTKLSINQEKISGFVDNELIGINNLAKIEGIKSIDNNAQVRFMTIIDGKETDMCHSLNNQLFYINKENEFNRYYGETQKDLSIQRIKCFGLVLGLNLPPISHHYHYCRSTITYQVPVEKKKETEYNLDIPFMNKEIRQILGKKKLNKAIKKLFSKYLKDDNVTIDYNNKKTMYYDIKKDKIILNPKHSDFKYYDLSESLSHEIIHMIDIRNNISDKLNIDNQLRRAEFKIELNKDKYLKMFNLAKYEDNKTLSDIFSAITNGKIKGNYYHSSKYWNEDSSRVTKEISANIMSAYLNNNKDTIKILDSIKSLKI